MDTSLRDRGIGGYRRRRDDDASRERTKGRNETHGALGQFLNAVEQGEVQRGSLLIVESLDRLTRIEPLDALELLRDIIRAGIEVVTLQDGQRYSSASLREIGPLINALVIMSRGHEESHMKAERLAASWGEKRSKAVEGRPMTRQTPAWLRVVNVRAVGNRLNWEDAKFEVIEERASIVRAIFEKRAAGWGRRRIAGWLNDQKPPISVWGRGKRRARGGWQESYIHKILTSRAVLGEYQPHKLRDGRYSPRVPVGDPIRDYYPRVISDDVWFAAQAHNAEARPMVGRPGNTLLTGLLVDQDGAPMHVERKGQGCDYFATSKAFRRNGRPVYRWRLDHLESSVLSLVQGIDWARVLTDGSHAPELRRLKAQLAEISQQEDAIKAQLQRAAAAILEDLGVLGETLKGRASELTEQKRLLSASRARVQQEIEAIEETAELATAGAEQLSGDLKRDVNDPEIRMRLRRELRRLVKQIQVWPDGRSPDGDWVIAAEAAARRLSGNQGLGAKAAGRTVGAIRITLQNGKAITTHVTYRPSARADRDPHLLGFTDPVGWSLDDWFAAWSHAGWENVLDRAVFAPGDRDTARLGLTTQEVKSLLSKKR